MTPATALLIAWAVGMSLVAGIALGRWRHWRREYEDLRRYHLKTMETAQAPFIRPAPAPDVAPILAEIDEIRREIDGAVGISNVVEVDFRRRP